PAEVASGVGKRDQLLAVAHLFARLEVDFLHHALARRVDRVLHLHRLHHQQGVAGLHAVARLNGYRYDLARHGRGQAATRVGGSILRVRHGVVKLQGIGLPIAVDGDGFPQQQRVTIVIFTVQPQPHAAATRRDGLHGPFQRLGRIALPHAPAPFVAQQGDVARFTIGVDEVEDAGVPARDAPAIRHVPGVGGYATTLRLAARVAI